MENKFYNNGEAQFAEYLEKNKLQYIYQPKVSVLRQIGYTPDFFVLNNLSYYEVVGSRQGFNQLRNKIAQAEALVNLFIVKPDGKLYKYQNIRVEESLTRLSPQKIKFINFDCISFLNEKGITLNDLKNKTNFSDYMIKKLSFNGEINISYFDNLEKIYGDLRKYIRYKQRE